MSIDIEREDSLDSALSGQPQDERLLQSAADSLRGYALELKLSHTLGNGQWPDEEESAKAHHDHMMALAKGLDELRASRQGILDGSDHIAEASKMVQSDDMRAAFEQKFPVPAGIYWNEISEQYDALPGAAGFDDVEIYHGQWMGWQAARAHGESEVDHIRIPDDTPELVRAWLRDTAFQTTDHMHGAMMALDAFGVTGSSQGDGEALGFIPSSGLNNLEAGHPAKIYPTSAKPSPFEPHSPVYTRPTSSGGVPEGWRIEREAEDRITIDADALGFYVARMKSDRIADILLYALAQDLLNATPTTQPTATGAGVDAESAARGYLLTDGPYDWSSTDRELAARILAKRGLLTTQPTGGEPYADGYNDGIDDHSNGCRYCGSEFDRGLRWGVAAARAKILECNTLDQLDSLLKGIAQPPQDREGGE